MYEKVKMYNEPHAIVNQMEDCYCEMQPNEHGILCGLLREFMPRKIVEIGVAGGGYNRCNYEGPRFAEQRCKNGFY